MDEILARDQNQFREPHRRWLRHTYQEGPGFRFLATRGGRPPELDQHRSDAAIVRARARAVRLARDDGIAALVPERRGPRHPALKHPGWVEQVVIAVRLHTYWNAKRIAAELRRREIADVGHYWVSQLLDDLGAHRPSGPRERGPRYERASPNSLWHVDIKGPFFIQLTSRRYLKTWIIGLVDDHSRFVIGLRIATDQQSAPILIWLRDCVELCGRLLDLMS